jgi:hypothetical protein
LLIVEYGERCEDANANAHSYSDANAVTDANANAITDTNLSAHRFAFTSIGRRSR